MNAPTNISEVYNAIQMDWTIITDLTDIGRDTIIYYKLEWFERPCYSDLSLTCGTNYNEPTDGEWKEITDFTDSANRLATTKIHYSTGVAFPPNKDFEYRMRAQNGVGMGVASAITVVRTDDVPQ